MTTIALPGADNSVRHARIEVLPVVRIVIYARLSQNRSGLSTNTAIQVAECEKEAEWYARDNHVQVVIVERFEEDDKSASKFSTKPRPLFERMLLMTQQNKVDMVWCTEPERLVRRPRQMEDIIDLAETTDLRAIHFTSDDSYDLRTVNGIDRARSAVQRADRESRKISERVKRKLAANAAEGLSNGGPRAYGYQKGNMLLEESEVPVLREMREKIVGGWSFLEVNWDLNERGIKSAEGGEWAAATIRTILTNKRYVGIRVHKGVEYPAKWPAVFTPDEWDELQVIIQDRNESYGDRPKRRRYLLTGLLTCGKCGRSLVGQMKHDKAGSTPRRTYMCHKPPTVSRDDHGCHGVTVNAAPLEEFLRQAVIDHLDGDNLARLLSSGEDSTSRLKELLSERRQKLAHKKTLEDERADGLLGKDEFYRMRNRVVGAITALDEQITEARQQSIQITVSAGQSIAEAYDSGTEGFRRLLLERVIKNVEVKQSSCKPRWVLSDGSSVVFDPERVEIDWRELSNAVLYEVAALINEALHAAGKGLAPRKAAVRRRTPHVRGSVDRVRHLTHNLRAERLARQEQRYLNHRHAGHRAQRLDRRPQVVVGIDAVVLIDAVEDGHHLVGQHLGFSTPANRLKPTGWSVSVGSKSTTSPIRPSGMRSSSSVVESPVGSIRPTP
jgi:DNA invertase Pin-like site-specific DNA recombinase